MLPLLQHNVAQNTTTLANAQVNVAELLWGTGNPFNTKFDVIIGSDLTYDAEILAILLQTMADLCNPQGGQVILAYGRHRAVIEMFFELARERFVITHVDKKDLPSTKALKKGEFRFLKQISQPTGIVHMSLIQTQEK